MGIQKVVLDISPRIGESNIEESMKIFSLETKKHLVGWSVVVGLALNFVISILLLQSNECGWERNCVPWVGFPIRYEVSHDVDLITALISANTFIWILVVLIILSLIRKYKRASS